MVSGFICGSNSFPREEDEYERRTRSAGSSPRKCRSSTSKKSKNLYSNRGLDKFSALLAELEEKRQKIYTQFDPENISLVRFVYSSDDHDLKPIVVKVKPENHDKHNKLQQKQLSSSSMVVDIKKAQNVRSNMNNKRKNNKMGFYRKLRVYEWKEPKFYLPMIVILILLILVIFGRSFAIMCTSIGWYVIPTITNNYNGNNSSNLSFKRKDYANNRRLREKKLKMTSEGTSSFKSPV